eukprot:g316.t1
MYLSSDHSTSGPLLNRKQSSNQKERIAALVAASFAILLLFVVLYESNRFSSLRLENKRLDRDTSRLNREVGALRSTSNTIQHEKELLEKRLAEQSSNLESTRKFLDNQQQLTEKAEAEDRKVRQSLLKCERNAKKREEELEEQLESANREKRDLSIRLDTEQALSADWSKKIAIEKLAREDCEQKLNLLAIKISKISLDQNQYNTNSINNGAKIAKDNAEQ